MHRAVCVLLLGFLATVAAPYGSDAQQAAKVPRIGILTPVNARSAPQFVAFEERLRELGWVDGRSVIIDFRLPEKPEADLVPLATELVQAKVDVILATGPEAPLKAARQATVSIPIVTIAVNYDPVERGYAASFARPNGNVTGLYFRTLEIGAKQLQLLKEALPRVTRFAVLWERFSADQLPAVEAAALTLKVDLEKVEVRPPYDLEAAFIRIRNARVGGLLIAGSPVFFRERIRIDALVSKHRLPAIGGNFALDAERAGVLLGYGPILADTFRRAAEYVDRVLRGTSPSDLPIEQASKFEFAINLKAARTLGLALPQTLLQRADRVIQ